MLSRGQAQWLVDFMRSIPGNQPSAAQAQVPQQPQDFHDQQSAQYEPPYYEHPDHSSEYPSY